MKAIFISTSISDYVDCENNVCYTSDGDELPLKVQYSQEELEEEFAMGEPVYYVDGDLYSANQLEDNYGVDTSSIPEEIEL